MRDSIVTALQALIFYEAIAFTGRPRHIRSNFYGHTVLAVLWTSSPFWRLPLFTWEWTAFVHSMLPALLFPLVLYTLREHGLNRTGQYGLLTLYALPKVYAFCAGRALKHVDAMLHIFEASVRVFEAILEHCVEGARFARLQFQKSIVSSERFAEEHFPTQAVHARAIQMQLMYPESSAQTRETAPSSGQPHLDERRPTNTRRNSH